MTTQSTDATSAPAKRAMRVLLRVDFLRCFFPKRDDMPGTGELPVDGAHDIIAIANELSDLDYYDLIIDIEDFHPHNHESFYTEHPGKKQFDEIDLHGLRQILWNPHGRQNTWGAEPHPGLKRNRVSRSFKKGMDMQLDSYSGFYDNGHRKSTGLAEFLREEAARLGFDGVENDVIGLALKFCVTFTAIDSKNEGFKTRVIEDACRAIGPHEAAIAELTAAGVEVISSVTVPRKAA